HWNIQALPSDRTVGRTVILRVSSLLTSSGTRVARERGCMPSLATKPLTGLLTHTGCVPTLRFGPSPTHRMWAPSELAEDGTARRTFKRSIVRGSTFPRT